MQTSFSLRKPLLFVWLLVFLSPGRFPVPAQEKKPDESGIELIGRTDKEEAPAGWYLHDSKTNKQIAEVRSRWGFQALPPGKYSLSLSWKYGEGQVPYAEVQVEKNRVVQVKISSGIDLAGRSDKEEAPASWYLHDSKTKKQIAGIWGRWGFQPLPPGKYHLSFSWKLGEGRVPYTDVEVEKDKVVTVKILSGIELAGRTEKEQPPAAWYLHDNQTQKPIAGIPGRWGFQPLPPGKYHLSFSWKLGEGQVPYTDVEVEKDTVVTVKILSGIELAGRTEKEQPPAVWYLQDIKTKKPIAGIQGRWGFQPLPPGKYSLSFSWNLGEGQVTYTDVEVEKDKVVTVKLDSGVELAGATDKEPPPDSWYVYDSKTQKQMARVPRRWGFQPLPPGEYVVSAGPQAFPWAQVKVAAGQVVAVRIPDWPERQARVRGAGRKTEKERDPEAYKKLEEEVERAIRRGAAWLKKQNQFRSDPLDLTDENPTLGILALLHAGEFDRDPLATRCLDYVLRRPLNTPHGTYATALTAMALRDWDRERRFSPRVLECAQWLVENQHWEPPGKVAPFGEVWRYGDKVLGIGEAKKAGFQQSSQGKPEVLDVVRRGLVTTPSGGWDNSCSQFAVLGLHSAVHAGIKIPREVWERVEKHFRKTQDADGGWGYMGPGSTGSMTCAGLASLVVARHHLGQDKSAADPAVVRGLEWLAGHFTVEENPGGAYHYYYLYGLERVGVLAGTEFLGDHEWYPVGARYLIAQQNPDGSWVSRKGPPSGQPVTGDYFDTCYAILFLRRATLSLQGVATLPKPAPKVEPTPATLAVRYQGKGLPPALVPAMELVLDCSGSMNDPPVKGGRKSKYKMAREIMNQALDELPDDFQVGFRVFGHLGFWGNKPGLPPNGDPRLNTDSELKIAIGPLNELGPSKKETRRQLIKDWIKYVEPRGATPLVYSLLQAKKDLSAGWPGPKMVVVVTDGMETCGGKLEDVAAAYRKGDLELVVNIVGFGVPADEEKMLKEIAKQAGSKYYDARSADQLAAALKESVRTAYVVSEEKSKVEVARGQVNGEPLTIKPGKYQVRLMGIKSTPMAVEVKDGQRLELMLDKEGRLQRPED